MANTLHALWIPHPAMQNAQLVVGEACEVFFFKDAPPRLDALADMIFYFGPIDPANVVTMRGTVAAITHDTLGAIARVDADGAFAHVVLEDGTSCTLDATDSHERIAALCMVVELRDVEYPKRGG